MEQSYGFIKSIWHNGSWIFDHKTSCTWFNKESLELTLDYLSNRCQRTKIGDNFSSWAELSYRVFRKVLF